MGKINTRVHHKDQALEDHAHRLPDGSYTGGQLLKPNSNRSFPHTHLYQHMGKTLETAVAPVGGDHVHVTEAGITSGPVAMGQENMDDAGIPHLSEEQAEKAKIGDVDEGKWEKAKKISQESYGRVKWPFVNYMYGQLGGK